MNVAGALASVHAAGMRGFSGQEFIFAYRACDAEPSSGLDGPMERLWPHLPTLSVGS